MSKPVIKILVIGGTPDELHFFLTVPSPEPATRLEWVHVERVSEGFNRLAEARFDIILLDLSLQDSEGAETVVKMQARAEKTPILVLVAPDDQEMMIQAVQKGAQDCWLRNQRDRKQLLRTMLCAIERHRFIEGLIETSQSLAQQKSLIEDDRSNFLTKIAGTTAHELKQPLTALLGNIELMKLDENNSKELKGHITEIEKASQRISTIVSKMQEIRHKDANLTNEPFLLQLDHVKNILSVEDTDGDFRIIETCLKDQTLLRLSRARSSEEGFRRLENEPFDLILLDYLLADGNGLDFLKTLSTQGLHPPVVFITGQGDEMIAAKAIQAGAVDYLTKGRINKDSLLRAITYALEKARLAKEVSQIQKRFVEMSIRDELTGLYNRRYMEEILGIEFSRAKRYRTDLSCLIVDLDYFKEVNDSFGHAFGDFVLGEFAACLKNSTRSSDWRFRYGGEEFMLLVPNTDIHGARQLAEKLIKKYEEKIYDNGTYSTRVTVSIGIASTNYHLPSRWEDLVACADKALYMAKADGRNCVRVFPEIPEEAPKPRSKRTLGLPKVPNKDSLPPTLVSRTHRMQSPSARDRDPSKR
jgi:two-component system, cell cycle response regulator